MSIRIWINPTLAGLSGGRTDWTVSSGCATVGDAFADAFAAEPRLFRGLVDETGAVRPHIAVFCDGRRLAPADALAFPAQNASEIAILTAVSGG